MSPSTSLTLVTFSVINFYLLPSTPVPTTIGRQSPTDIASSSFISELIFPARDGRLTGRLQGKKPGSGWPLAGAKSVFLTPGGFSPARRRLILLQPPRKNALQRETSGDGISGAGLRGATVSPAITTFIPGYGEFCIILYLHSWTVTTLYKNLKKRLVFKNV
ncbi:UNVERIFIED_CONTAM: hypothetical protein PYX00_009658 [Menopon gallinae]|uniref:Uncharacterized protein n=1 Tax=Menopon gallinae TaxID=328185 RepID=A0AAW2HCG1_9NEOP